jgi:hypothetical protein
MKLWPPCHSAYTTFKSFRAGVQSTSPINATYALRYALFATRIFNATDPRDKIYGVLGITHDKTQQMIAPNYTKSVENVFCDAMTHVLFEEESAAIYAWFPLERTSRPTLPSWVPNFAAPRAVNYMRLPPLIDADILIKHSAADLRLSGGGKKLIVKGQVLDIVETVVTLPARNPMGNALDPRDARHRDIMDAIRDRIQTQDPIQEASLLSWLDRFIDESLYIVELSRVLINVESLARRCAEAWADARPTQTLLKVLLGSKDDTTQDKEMHQEFDQMIQAMRELIASIDTDNWQMQIDKIASLLSTIMNVKSLGNLVLSLDVGRKFFTGYGGWYGLAEGDVEAGDQLAVLFPGAGVPFVIREKGVDSYEMVGIARTPPDRLTTAVTSRREITII